MKKRMIFFPALLILLYAAAAVPVFAGPAGILGQGDLPAFVAEYQEKNADTVGWLAISGITVETPVMQNQQDKNYYLRRDFHQNYDFVGTPYVDYRSLLGNGTREGIADRTVIYLGTTTDVADDKAYNNVKALLEPEKLEQIPHITFSTDKESMQWEIICVGVVSYEVPYYNPGLPRTEWEAALETVRAAAVYDSGIQPKAEDKFLILSTSYFGKEDKGMSSRMAVIARLLPAE